MCKFYEGDIVPSENTVFVFGSNFSGIHGRGSAFVAVKQFGAKHGIGEGLVGSSYALPTVNLKSIWRPNVSPEVIADNIVLMYDCAKKHPDKDFKVAYRNKGDEKTLCGYTAIELSSMFKEAGKRIGGIPTNVWFSTEWSEYFTEDDYAKEL